MEELLTLREAADRLGVHVTTLRSWVREGKLPAYRLGRRFTRVSWAAVLDRLDIETTPDTDLARPGEAQPRSIPT